MQSQSLVSDAQVFDFISARVNLQKKNSAFTYVPPATLQGKVRSMLEEKEKIQSCIKDGRVSMTSLKKVNQGVYNKLKHVIKTQPNTKSLKVPYSMLQNVSDNESTDAYESSWEGKTMPSRSQMSKIIGRSQPREHKLKRKLVVDRKLLSNKLQTKLDDGNYNSIVDSILDGAL